MKIFISYSRKDKLYKNELLKQLSSLQRDKIIDGWHDSKLLPGDKWDEGIKKALYECDIVLFLVSADLMASEYINNTEIKISRERYENKEIKIIPVITRPCAWESTFGEFQALPKNAKPLSTWKNIDEGLLDITKGIIRIVDEIKNDETIKENNNSSSEPESPIKSGMNINNAGAKIGKQININEVNNLKID